MASLPNIAAYLTAPERESEVTRLARLARERIATRLASLRDEYDREDRHWANERAIARTMRP